MIRSLYIIVIFSLLIPFSGQAQIDSTYLNRTLGHFEKAYSEINAMLDGTLPLSFKRAVFLVENAYEGDSLSEEGFNRMVGFYKQLVLSYAKANRLVDYHYPDSTAEVLNAALFRVFTDTVWGPDGTVISLPFLYNFEDALGSKEYSSTFVSTLIATKKGNCHSMPYFYKILTEELSTKSYLAYAPMHIYIKQRNKHAGWYNVELTSGEYPRDAYLISSGYISQRSMTSGLYMDTLSLRESVAACLMDLGRAYAHKVGPLPAAEFEMRCADRTLEVKRNHASALLAVQRLHYYYWQKALEQGLKNEVEFHKASSMRYNLILLGYGYEEVNESTFRRWYTGYNANKSEYANPLINGTFKLQK